jgi:hypothetical protein
MSVAFTERTEFKRGRACELVVSAFLQERDWFVIPSYDYAGLDHDKPPRLQGLRTAYPIPDLDTCRDGKRRWLEVKGKASARMFYKTGAYQHGIHNYEHYLSVQEQTGTPVWLAIVEYTDIHTGDELGEAGLLLVQSLDGLGEPQRGTLLGKPAAFWPRRSFLPLYRFTNLPNVMEEVLSRSDGGT